MNEAESACSPEKVLQRMGARSATWKKSASGLTPNADAVAAARTRPATRLARSPAATAKAGHGSPRRGRSVVVGGHRRFSSR